MIRNNWYLCPGVSVTNFFAVTNFAHTLSQTFEHHFISQFA